MQWWWGPKENYISFKDIFTFLKIFSCDGALYLESLFWISTGAQLISQSSTGTKCLTVIPFDAVYAACRVCVRDGANWVCIITNCCKGKSMKVKASGSCGTHPWRRQTHTHTLLPHLQSKLDEYNPSATDLFHIKRWKVSKSHKGQRIESCATWTIKKKKITAMKPTALVRATQDWNCRCSLAEHEQFLFLCSTHKPKTRTSYFRRDYFFLHFFFFHISEQQCDAVHFSNVLVPSRRGSMQTKTTDIFLFPPLVSTDFTKAIRYSAWLHPFYVCEEASGGEEVCPLYLGQAVHLQTSKPEGSSA